MQQSPPLLQAAPSGKQAATRVTGVALRIDCAEDWFGVLSAKSGPEAHKTKAIATKNPIGKFKFLMRCLPGMGDVGFCSDTMRGAPLVTPIGLAALIILQGKALAYSVSRGTPP